MKKDNLADWIRKAEGDYNSANREIKVKEKENYDLVCILCQQCAEKYLKAFQIFHQVKFEWTHDLLDLLNDCVKIDASFEFLRNDCAKITDMFRLRYPSDFAVFEDAKLALHSVKIIRKIIREKLGLTKRKSLKKKNNK